MKLFKVTIRKAGIRVWQHNFNAINYSEAIAVAMAEWFTRFPREIPTSVFAEKIK